MKKLFMLVVVCLFVFSFVDAPRLYAAEVLKVTRDHFEFRDAPKVDEDSLIGTLRIDTPVEWTGNVSGKWFEIKAPNGQIGWVHESGVSRPKSPVKQRKSPEPAPAAPRKTSQSSSAEVSKLKAAVKELEKAKEQSEAQLQEKDRRIQELSEELRQVEEKLSDTGQMLEDQEQMRTLNERKVTEAENELLTLQGTIKENDEALLMAKVETTKLENQLQGLRAQQSSPLSPERILLMLSLLVNLLGLLFFFVVRKRLSAATELAPAIMEEDEHVYQERPEAERLEQEPLAEAVPEAGTEASELQEEKDDHLKELDVVMTAPHSDDESTEDVDRSDDVEIDLGDVLPAAATAVGAAAVAVSSSENTEQEEAEALLPLESDVIIVEEPIERIDEIEEEIATETVAEELPLEDESVMAAVIEEPQAEDLQESLSESVVLEISDEPEDLLELEDAEELLDEPEELLEIEDAEETLEEIEAEIEEVEELLLDEEGGVAVDENEISEVSIEELEVSGETFEKLPKGATQLIESEDEDDASFEEGKELPMEDVSDDGEEDLLQDEAPEENGENDDDMIIGNPGIIDEDDYENEAYDFESSTEAELGSFETEEANLWGEDAVEELPETEDVMEALPEAEEIVEDPPDAEKRDEKLPEPKEFEVEEIVVIDEMDQGVSKALHDEREERGVAEETLDISPEVEELLELENADPTVEPKTAPSFLEPSPFLIEPENEPEELSEDAAKEEAYDIELLDAGNNKDSVIHVLSKVNGLTASPKELVESVPCLIAKGAGKDDAESFQLIMQKMGAKVRILSKG